VLQAPSLPADASRQTQTRTVRRIYALDAPGVVLVNAVGVSQAQSPSEYLKGEGGQRGTATGSGFEIDGNGTILTNWHVVENAAKVTVELERGKAIEAQVIGKDPAHDLAVLRIPTGGLSLHPLALGDSSKAHVGDPVLAIGNPFGLGQTLTTGVISALQRQITAPSGVSIDNVLQTDAPINPGNSGGPLLNEEGQVIGINSQIETAGSGGGSVGIAFAIPIDTAEAELPVLEKGGTVCTAPNTGTPWPLRAWLGNVLWSCPESSSTSSSRCSCWRSSRRSPSATCSSRAAGWPSAGTRTSPRPASSSSTSVT
jgi:S1-C subfamily serine protease